MMAKESDGSGAEPSGAVPPAAAGVCGAEPGSAEPGWAAPRSRPHPADPGPGVLCFFFFQMPDGLVGIDEWGRRGN